MHRAIYGSTGSGKTYYMLTQAGGDIKAGRRVVALDPMLAAWPAGVRVHTSWDEKFHASLTELSNAGGGSVYIDEADTALSMQHRKNWWIMQRGRHHGYSMTIASQRPALVAPTCRGQCSNLVLFRLSKNDAKMLTDDTANPGVMGVTGLRRGEAVFTGWNTKTREIYAIKKNLY